MPKKVIHVDCDCFYAALEMRDFPQLRNKPVAVGGRSSRSVIATCNYEARRYGVRSAMPTARALALCPNLVIQPARFDVYREVAGTIREIFYRYTDLVEPLSLDEAYLDVSESDWFAGSATLLAQHIRQEIFQETGITASAGVAPNKFLAKIASDWNKPDGLFVIPPAQVKPFVDKLPVQKISGVGQKFREKLNALGINTCSDVLNWPLPKLIDRFGKSGYWLHQRARGIDNRNIGASGERKSSGIERTYSKDLISDEDCFRALEQLFDGLNHRRNFATEAPIKSLQVKVRFNDFMTTTVERRVSVSLESVRALFEKARRKSERPIRLLGISLRYDDPASETQLEFWPVPESKGTLSRATSGSFGNRIV